MHRRLLAALAVLATSVVVALASPSLASAPLNFAAPLSGDQEVADEPVVTDATGVAKFQLSADGTEMSYRLNVGNIENVLMAHIHLPAARGANAGIAVWLYPGEPPFGPTLIPGRTNGTLATGTFTADDFVGALEGETMQDLVDHIRAGNAYVNVHTSQFGGGEIRGQIDVPHGLQS